jgi:glyoxylate/hydroxypyruvate reductase
MSVASHLHSRRFKVVVCRNLGPDVMSILEARPELDVSQSPIGAAR